MLVLLNEIIVHVLPEMATKPTTQQPATAQHPSTSHNIGESVNYKKKYRALKRKMRMLIYVSANNS
jgi:hypothetical protein